MTNQTERQKEERYLKDCVSIIKKNIEEYEKGFVTFQKRYVRPKNIITSALFVIIAILYIEQIIKDPKYAIAWMMLGVSIAFIFMIWFNANKIRKNLIKAIKGLEDDKYETNFYNSYIKIKTILPVNEEDEYEEEIPESIVNFDYDKVSVLDTETMYIIYQKKRVYYQIPKRCLNEDEMNFMNNYFSRKAGKEFIKIK